MDSSDKLSNKMLQDEQRSKLENNFFMLAHDIQSPIHQVQSLLKIALSMTDDHNELKMILEKALTSNLTLKNKVDQILSLSVKSNNKPQKIDFKQLLENVKLVLHGNAGYAETKFIIRVEDGLQYYGNKATLQSIFQNLLENAIKYRKPDATKNIIVLSIASGDGCITIKITDNGRGIRKEVLPHIFDRKFKVNESDHGHGIGLHLVKENLRAIGARLGVESVEGEGTTFTIQLVDQLALWEANIKKEKLL